jgi:Domain of unknown function (DUF4157)
MSPPGKPSAGTPAAGLSAPARPLEAGTRDQLSAAFGRDFSAVRVHTGPDADTAARDVGARAYTVGRDVVFRNGAYDPLSATGRSVIAHELAHVAQYGGQVADPLTGRTGGPPPAPARLERQAHVAAALAGRDSLPRGWAWERSSGPFIGKAGVEWTPAIPHNVPYPDQTQTITQEQWDPDDPTVARIDMGQFDVPVEKGPWQEHYDPIAKAGGLQAQIAVGEGGPSSGLKQKRAPTDELRELWLQRVRWPASKANVWWNEAGGDATTESAFRPRAGGREAQIDHIVELQLGGTNVPDNLAPHTDTDNMTSGRKIWNDLAKPAQAIAETIAQRPKGDQLRNVILRFSSAKQSGTYPIKTLPALPEDANARGAIIEERRGKAVKALDVHFTALKDTTAGIRPDAAERADSGAELAHLSPYPIAAGPSAATLLVPVAPQGDDKIEGSPVRQNDAARELIAGLTLEKLHRTPEPTGHVITAWLNSADHKVRSGTKLPIQLKNAPAEQIQLQVTDVGKTGQLSILGGSKQVRFTYPYLSEGQLALQVTEAGLVGRGTITPSLPLLRRAPIQVTLDRDGMRGDIAADPDTLSLQPFRVTEAVLRVGLAPELSAGGHLAFELGSFVSGGADITVDANGLLVAGDVRAHIRGLDRSDGHIEYRPATGLSGYVVAAATGTGSFITSGEARVDFTGTDWAASGRLDLMLPGHNPAQLSVLRRGGRLIYTGRTTLTVPGLHPVDVELSYDGEHISGSAHTSVEVLGMTGDMRLNYRDGDFTGEGVLLLRRGRVSGQLKAALDEQGRVSGEGRASLEIRPGLVGTATVVLTPEHHLSVTGELAFPPYRFLEPRADRFQLFHRDLPDIPLFAIPLGPRSIGLVARISAGLNAQYGFGPGELRDMVIKAGFDPLEQDTNVRLGAQARLVLPAYAGLELSLRAGVGLSIAIGSVTAGITVTGGAMLRGGLDARVTLAYAKSILVFDAEATISVQPVLTLAIDADIVAEAFGFGEHRWPYQLAAWSYPTGLQFGLQAPFHYESDQPLRLPAASDIKWIVPDIDVRALAEQIGGQVRAGLGF